MTFHPLRQGEWTHDTKYKHSIIFLNIYFREEFWGHIAVCIMQLIFYSPVYYRTIMLSREKQSFGLYVPLYAFFLFLKKW